MERFDFFFGLHLGGRLHSHTNNLSKDLQGTDWRLVLVHQATPKLPKITLEGSIMRSYWSYRQCYLSRKLQFLRPDAWRPSWLKLVMVTTIWGRVKVFGNIIQRRCWYRGATWHAIEYFGSYVMGEDGCQCVLTKSCWRCQSFQNQKRS